ncbi:hypothetical protein ALC56_06990 [Trachymyrmex septentrionalis]|uniref:Uncharacterized protein n=2 Tax=Trachymyrmex septentrionalis TaxID=34720 RepID=A0A151JWE1_9HYME|nr:hypothetical protein ALC56_06990 [Trachymyrmex septentrionalis]
MGVSWKSWDEAANRAVRSLNTSSHRALQTDERSGIKTSVPSVIPFLLESADDSAKLIVPL